MVRKEIDPAKGVNDLRRFHEACERGLLDVVEQSLGAFNIFSVLSVGNYEIRHSNMLAWLFTPGASHGCGAAFLDNVLRRIVERNPEKKEYARFLRI